MTSVVRSTKDLWVLISGSSLLRSKELVGSELEMNSLRILQSVSYFKQPNSVSQAKLSKEVTDKSQLAFIEKLSKLLNIDEVKCYQLLCSYLVYEYRGTADSLKQCFRNERHSQSLLYELWNFYYSERLYGMLCLKHVLCHYQDDTHPYQDLYTGFMDLINKNGEIGSCTINQFELVSSAEMPNRESYGHYYNDSLSYRWIVYNLKEQLELLQILLLYYKDTEPNLEEVFKLLTLFQKHSFGQKLSYRQHINDVVQHLVDSLGFLEGILFVECLELEWLYKCSEDKIPGHYLLKENNLLQVVDRAVCCLGNHPQHGLLMLAWMLFRHLSNNEKFKNKFTNVQLGSSALKLHVFSYISSCLRMQLLSGSGIVANILNTVVYSLVSVLLSAFELKALGEITGLFEIAESVLKYSNTAQDFWEKNETEGLHQLLSESLAMFPYEFSPLIKLLNALSQAGTASCQKVLALMDKLPSFSEVIDNFNESITLYDQCQLREDKQTYWSDAIVICKGTIGQLLPLSDKSKTPVMRWHQAVSGWLICTCELHVHLNRISLGKDYITTDMINRILDIASLVHHTILSNSKWITQMDEVIRALISILNKLSVLAVPPTEVLASCINVIAAIAKKQPKFNWEEQLDNNLLPFPTGNPETIAELASGVYCNVGVIGQQVVLQEQINGKYELLLSFLDLTDVVVEDVSKGNDPSFLANLVFIFRDIFPNHHKWRYIVQGTRETIGQKCLNIFHKLLQVTDYSTKKHLSKGQELCIYRLMFTDDAHALLRIVTTGENVIRSAMEQQGSHLSGIGQQLTSLVRLSLSVLNRLLLLRHSLQQSLWLPSSGGLGQSTLEQNLLSVPSQPNQLHAVLGVAYYSFQRYDPRLAALSVLLLRRFAQGYPMSLSACLGCEATAVRDLFLLRLKSSTEDIRLKVAIFRFLTACVRNQPGLLEMFVNTRNEDLEGEQNDDINCLQCAVQVLKDAKKELTHCPKELHCAVVEFIHSLWSAHHLLAIHQLKQEPSLWSLLSYPLFREDSWINVDSRITAFVLHTLALQGFQESIFGQDQVDTRLKAVYKEMEENRLSSWSKHIHKCLPTTSSDSELTCHQLDSSLLSDETRHTFLLLVSWRDFLLILAKEKLFRVSLREKESIMGDILSSIKSQISLSGNQQLLILLVELYFMLLQFWENEMNFWDNWSQDFGDILEIVSSNCDRLDPKIVLYTLSTAILGVHMLSKQNSFDALRIASWMPSTCLFIKILTRPALKPLKDGDGLHMQLAVMSITLLKELVTLLIENMIDYVPLLERHSLVPLLNDLLITSFQLRKGAQISQAILSLFLTLSFIPQVSEMLSYSDFLQQTTLLLLSTYQNGKETMSKNENQAWEDVFCLYLQVVTGQLEELNHFGLNDALNFVGVHLEKLVSIFQKVKLQPHTDAVMLALHACSFVQALSRHKKSWRLQHAASYQLLLASVCETCGSIVAYLIRPTLLQYMIKHQKLAISTSLLLEHPEIPARAYPSGNEATSEKVAPELVAVKTRLMELLAVSLKTLQTFSPGLQDILCGQLIDVNQWEILLHASFVTPGIEQSLFSFGTILSCINVCISAKSRPAYENLFGNQKFLFSYVLEMSLVFLLSQSALYQITSTFSPRDRQLLRRELNAELSSLVLSLSRAMKKGSSLLSPLDEATGKPKRSFLKFLIQLVDKFFK